MKKEVQITSVTEISATKSTHIGTADAVAMTSEGMVLVDTVSGMFFAVVKGHEVEGHIGSELKGPWVKRRAGEFVEKAIAEVAKAKRRKPKVAKAA